MHQMFQPGGRLQEDQWMLSMLTVYDFLPAATVGCPDLSVRLESQSTFRDESEMNGLVSKGILALKQSQKIRVSNSHNTSESRVASLALDLMVRRAAEIQAASSCDRAMQSTGHVSIVSELSYTQPMSEMIDGAEMLDWARYINTPTLMRSANAIHHLVHIGPEFARSWPWCTLLRIDR
jgi:hypothetical protein